ncbi:MAG: flagellar hook assembly protein FlgD [Pseudomonadota bacterium]
MSVNTVSSSATAGATSPQTEALSAETLDYQGFLQLLIAQLENQDPLNPMDSTEYVAQLASFSEVEQSIKSNDQLEELLSETRLTQASSVVGKTVTSFDGSIQGTVTSVLIEKGESIAVLDSGNVLRLDDSVTISAPAAAAEDESGSSTTTDDENESS